MLQFCKIILRKLKFLLTNRVLLKMLVIFSAGHLLTRSAPAVNKGWKSLDRGRISRYYIGIRYRL